MRLTRSGMIEALQSDHVRTARAYGLSRWRVVIQHGLRHAIIPVVSLAAVQLGFMLGGSIVIETVFSLKASATSPGSRSTRRHPGDPGDSAGHRRDLCVLTLVADILNAALDPRIRIG